MKMCSKSAIGWSQSEAYCSAHPFQFSSCLLTRGTENSPSRLTKNLLELLRLLLLTQLLPLLSLHCSICASRSEKGWRACKGQWWLELQASVTLPHCGWKSALSLLVDLSLGFAICPRQPSCPLGSHNFTILLYTLHISRRSNSVAIMPLLPPSRKDSRVKILTMP